MWLVFFVACLYKRSKEAVHSNRSHKQHNSNWNTCLWLLSWCFFLIHITFLQLAFQQRKLFLPLMLWKSSILAWSVMQFEHFMYENKVHKGTRMAAFQYNSWTFICCFTIAAIQADSHFHMSPFGHPKLLLMLLCVTSNLSDQCKSVTSILMGEKLELCLLIIGKEAGF